MHTETELKLFVALQDFDSLVKTLHNLPNSTYCKSDFLFNHYFDTCTLQLARWDMGLRVRGSKNHQEQTIKTTGSVSSGLHSRPEFNVTTAEKTPNLFLFPQHIWPLNTDLQYLNNNLNIIFETNFTRQTWLININHSTIEVALDKGEVIAGHKTKLIHELELELMKGQNEDLIVLAQLIANDIPIRLAEESKAVTGYLLSGKMPYQFKTAWPNLLDATTVSANTCLQSRLKTGLNHWLELERYLEHVNNSVNTKDNEPSVQKDKQAEYAQFFNQLTHCIDTLQDLALTDKKLKSQLTDDEQITAFIKALLDNPMRIESLWRSTGYGKFQLALLAYLTRQNCKLFSFN